MLKTLLRYFKPHMRLFVLDMVCAFLAAGVELEPKKISFESTGRVSGAYQELESAAMDLMTLIRASKGLTNKDLKKMASQIKAMTEKWQG